MPEELRDARLAEPRLTAKQRHKPNFALAILATVALGPVGM
jgi:hypothetical protein